MEEQQEMLMFVSLMNAIILLLLLLAPHEWLFDFVKLFRGSLVKQNVICLV